MAYGRRIVPAGLLTTPDTRTVWRSLVVCTVDKSASDTHICCISSPSLLTLKIARPRFCPPCFPPACFLPADLSVRLPGFYCSLPTAQCVCLVSPSAHCLVGVSLTTRPHPVVLLVIYELMCGPRRSPGIHRVSLPVCVL